jgi:hypothetical protein
MQGKVFKDKVDVEKIRKLVDMGYTDAQIARKLNTYPFTVRKLRSENEIERFNSRGGAVDDDIPLTPMKDLPPRVQAYLRSKGR